MSKVVLPPLPEPVYHQWRRKNMPWSLEFAFNSMCHATTDDSEVRTLHTADQLRAYGIEVARLVLEAAAQAAQPDDSYRDEWFCAKADAVKRIRGLEPKP